MSSVPIYTLLTANVQLLLVFELDSVHLLDETPKVDPPQLPPTDTIEIGIDWKPIR